MLQLPSLLGEEYQLLFDTAVHALRDTAVATEGDEPDSAARSLWRLSVELGWVDGCLAGRSADAFRSAATLAEAHGYAGVIGPLPHAIVAGATLVAGGMTPDQEPLAGLIGGKPVVAWLGRVDAARAADIPAAGDSVPYAALDTILVPFMFSGHAIVPLDAGHRHADGSGLAVVNCYNPYLETYEYSSSGGNYLRGVAPTSVPADAFQITGDRARAAVLRHDVVGALVSAAELAGIGRAALELTVEYVQRRVQFGRPIGTFQAVHHHAADMLRDLTAVRLLVAQAASRLDRDLPAEREAWMAKAKAAEAIPALLRMAHQLTGGAGFYRDYPLEGYLRRAIDTAAAYGNASNHRRRLGAMLRDDPGRFRGPDAHIG